MKKMILWLPVSALVLLALPWLAVTYAKADAGMAVCLLLLFVVNPVFSILSGIHAGRNIKSLWLLPILTAAFFLTGAWLFLDRCETAFLLYALIYLGLGSAAMLLTVPKKKKHAEES